MQRVIETNQNFLNHTQYVGSNYAEESQDFPVKFETYAFVGGPQEQSSRFLLHGKVKCRDFLGDVGFSYTFQNASSIYGFSIDYYAQIEKAGKSPSHAHGWKITFPTKEAYENFNSNMPLFTSGMHMNNFYSTKFLDDESYSCCLDFPWPNYSGITASLVSWLIKIAAHKWDETLVSLAKAREFSKFFSYFRQKYNDKDARYIDRVNPEIFNHLETIYALSLNTELTHKLFKKYKDNISFLHNSSGFFSQFNKDIPARADLNEFRNVACSIIASYASVDTPFHKIPLGTIYKEYKVTYAVIKGRPHRFNTSTGAYLNKLSQEPDWEAIVAKQKALGKFSASVPIQAVSSTIPTGSINQVWLDNSEPVNPTMFEAITGTTLDDLLEDVEEENTEEDEAW